MTITNNKSLEQQVSDIFDSITVFPTEHFQSPEEIAEMSHNQFINVLTFLLEGYEDYITIEDKQELLQALKTYNRLLAYLTVLNVLKRTVEALSLTQGLEAEIGEYHTEDLMDHSGYSIVDFDHEDTEELEQYLSEFG